MHEDMWAPAPDTPRDRVAPVVVAPPAPLRTYLGLSFVALFFFLPCGVVAVVRSLAASRLWHQGSDIESQRAARSARAWAIAALLLSPLQAALVAMLWLLGVLAIAFS